MKIALDAMGGDFAPANEVKGAIEFVNEFTNHELILVGNEKLIRKHMNGFESDRISIVHADQIVTMKDQPTVALKEKKDSSMSIGLKLQKEGKADAFVSAGHTGAQLAFSGYYLKRIKGVSRAAIGGFLPNAKRFSFIMDIGANADCKPINLYQFAVMGDIMIKHMYNFENPTVGLLSIGEEDSKGNELTIAANKLLRESNHLNFYGNIEGRDILHGTTDIIICDGFTGNVVLKMAESTMKAIGIGLKKGVGKNPLRMLGAALINPAFQDVKKLYDYQTYGGVPLLGVDGISIICHGKSSPLAIKNAILQAIQMFEADVNTKIKEELH
jgi:glycerol-3-phosphate acyltransferase PlsX